MRATPLRAIVPGLDDDRRRVAVRARRRGAAAERLDGVVDEVDDDPADLLDVDAHRAAAPRRSRRSIRIVAEQPVVERQRVGRAAAFRSAGTARGAGIRANCANSSTSSLSDSTSPTIVAVHSSTSVARPAPARTLKWRRMRSAHS